VYLNTEGRWS